jgi:hypothetical protein
MPKLGSTTARNTSMPIKTFKQPAPAPRPPSPSAKQLVDQAKRIASAPPGIDPLQQHY